MNLFKKTALKKKIKKKKEKPMELKVGTYYVGGATSEAGARNLIKAVAKYEKGKAKKIVKGK